MSRASKKVLVGDRDTVVLALVSHVLQRQGFTVDASSDPRGIIQRIRDAVYDAIIVDLHLDGVSDLIQSTDGSRIILTTPHDPPALPVCSILRKPLELGELVDATRRCVNPK